jgi:hypothetical protein
MALLPACTCLSCPAHRGAVVAPAAVEAFGEARRRFESVVSQLAGPAAGELSHAELEAWLQADAREVFRLLLQGHLDLRAARETRRSQVTGADGVTRSRAETGHQRGLATVFGPVRVTRMAYRAPGTANLHPADAVLSLPAELHSHGLRRLTAIEAARGSYGELVAAARASTGAVLGKRQAEQLAVRAAADFDGFYQSRPPLPGAPGDVLVVSLDGKGIVMRPESLRQRTAAAAARASPRLHGRRSKGEPHGRKRMAQVGAVYNLAPVPRSPADIMTGTGTGSPPPRPAPAATSKWLTASITRQAAAVIGQVFDEADRRDPGRQRTRVALADGANHQISRIHAEAAARELTVVIVIDFVHVLEYLWKAAWCFHHEGDPAAGHWVRRHASAILQGDAAAVVGQIRQQATAENLSRTRRKAADRAAGYLTRKHPYLDYPTALARGWPIATGVIEGACRHLIADRLDITGARWGLAGAEAILKLRALRANGDFDTYWTYHLTREHHRNHQTRYASNTIPDAA